MITFLVFKFDVFFVLYILLIKKNSIDFELTLISGLVLVMLVLQHKLHFS